jgi:hypothetical protein
VSNVPMPSRAGPERRTPRRHRRALTRAFLVIVLAVAALLTQMPSAQAYTIDYQGGTRILVTSKRLHKTGVHVTMHVELRIDGTYQWWANVKGAWMYRGYEAGCIIYVTDRKIPLRITTGARTIGRNRSVTIRSPEPTLMHSRIPENQVALIRDHWHDLFNGFTARCFLD